MTTSVCLTVHNKESILKNVLERIYAYTTGNYELIVALDGCADRSEEILLQEMRTHSALRIKTSVIYLNNVFETKANNACLRKATGDYVCIIQDDMLIDEIGYNERMLKPFLKFQDVFAVTARCAHNWKLNPNSQDINNAKIDANRWSDILIHCDHADKTTITTRNTFAIRDCVNRGPLMLNRHDVVKLRYLDEAYAPQEFDDHDICMRAKKELGKVCGYYGIDWHTRPEYGGTRDEHGNTKQWLLEANHRNSRLFAEFWANSFEMVIRNRTV